jgi:hypothetical protein
MLRRPVWAPLRGGTRPAIAGRPAAHSLLNHSACGTGRIIVADRIAEEPPVLIVPGGRVALYEGGDERFILEIPFGSEKSRPPDGLAYRPAAQAGRASTGRSQLTQV